MKDKRIVITGLGCVSPIGNTVKKSWINLLKGRSGISKIQIFDTKNMSSKLAGQVNNFDIKKYLSFNEYKYMNKYMYFCIASIMEAIDDSNFIKSKIDSKRIGFIIGSSLGSVSYLEKIFFLNKKEKNKYINFGFFTSYLNNTIGSFLAIKYKLFGLNFNISNSCTSGSYSIGIGYRLIKYGDSDIIITGASESSISKSCINFFSSLGVLSIKKKPFKEISSPFDKYRNGFIISEGAGIIILEEYTHAIKRNAKIYCELIGFGMNNNIFNTIKPDIYGLYNSMNISIKDSKINYNEIDYINTHASSTILGDINEINAIKYILKKHAYNIKISSPKSITGHLLGASSSLEVIFTALSIFNQIIPPTINIKYQDPLCDLNYCKLCTNLNINIALNNSSGFGGQNITLIFKKIS